MKNGKKIVTKIIESERAFSTRFKTNEYLFEKF